MGHLGPVGRRDEDGREADGLVGPLQSFPTLLPPALHTQGEGGVAPLALQVHAQAGEALALLHHREEPLPPQLGAGLAGVGDEVEGRSSSQPDVPVAARAEPDAEAKDEDDEDADGDQ